MSRDVVRDISIQIIITESCQIKDNVSHIAGFKRHMHDGLKECYIWSKRKTNRKSNLLNVIPLLYGQTTQH